VADVESSDSDDNKEELIRVIVRKEMTSQIDELRDRINDLNTSQAASRKTLEIIQQLQTEPTANPEMVKEV
jgi:prefoldin subunit 5